MEDKNQKNSENKGPYGYWAHWILWTGFIGLSLLVVQCVSYSQKPRFNDNYAIGALANQKNLEAATTGMIFMSAIIALLVSWIPAKVTDYLDRRAHDKSTPSPVEWIQRTLDARCRDLAKKHSPTGLLVGGVVSSLLSLGAVILIFRGDVLIGLFASAFFGVVSGMNFHAYRLSKE